MSSSLLQTKPFKVEINKSKSYLDFISSSALDLNKSILPIEDPCGHYPPLTAAVEREVRNIVIVVIQGVIVDACIGCNGMTSIYMAAQEVGHSLLYLGVSVCV